MFYTKDDLKNLYSMFSGRLGRHLYFTEFPGMLLISNRFDPNRFFPSLKKVTRKENDLFNLFFVDFKELPLFVPSTNFAVNAIVTWRFQLGK